MITRDGIVSNSNPFSVENGTIFYETTTMFPAFSICMKLENTLDKVHSSAVSNRLLQLFTAFTRVLLGVGFIYPSIPKIMNRPFTILPDSDPVGHYFNALYQTGYYYQFIGWSQLIAAVLLLIPRTSHIGALMFFPIILNITVLTNSVGFKGTWLITIFMSLACLYLVCWEYDKWKPILFSKGNSVSKFSNLEFFWLPGLFSIGAVVSLSSLAYFVAGETRMLHLKFLAMIAVVSGLFGFGVALHHKLMRTGA